MNKYTDEFLKLKCAGDVLNCVRPMHNPSKKISEAMAVVKLLRQVVLRNPGKYKIAEMNSGNALTSILALHLLPIKAATAYNYKRQNEIADNVRGFYYDVNNCDPYNNEIDGNTIIIDTNNHANNYMQTLSIMTVGSCNKFIILPDVSYQAEDEFIKRNLGSTGAGALAIRTMMGGRIYQDRRILGKKNIIVYWLGEE